MKVAKSGAGSWQTGTARTLRQGTNIMKGILRNTIFCTFAFGFIAAGCAVDGSMAHEDTGTSTVETVQLANTLDGEQSTADCNNQCLRSWGTALANCGAFDGGPLQDRCRTLAFDEVNRCVTERCESELPADRVLFCMNDCRVEGTEAVELCSESKSTVEQCATEGEEVFLTCYDADCAGMVAPAAPAAEEVTTTESVQNASRTVFTAATCEQQCESIVTQMHRICEEAGYSAALCTEQARGLLKRCYETKCN